MDNLRTALTLCLIGKRYCAIHTNRPDACIHEIKGLCDKEFDMTTAVEIDLLKCKDYADLTSQMVYSKEGEFPRLYDLVLWKNLETLKMDFATKDRLLKVFNELERYNTVASRNVDASEPVKFGEYYVIRPRFFLILAVIPVHRALPKLNYQIKDRFWYSQSVFMPMEKHVPKGSSVAAIEAARLKLRDVYASPEIQEYICSLLVFTRSHRLCSIAPLTTRPSFRALDGIMELAKALVVLNNSGSTELLYVTPEYVKVAYRRIGYWLVDWETNAVFNDEAPDSEYRKRMEISMLIGDWYGSEWNCVSKYLAEHIAEKDEHSATGFTNKIVEEVLESVQPPI